MSDESLTAAPIWRKPILCIIGLAVVLCMLRLGVWQLDRADQKRDIVSQLESRTTQTAVPLQSIANDVKSDDLRFRNVLLAGHYLSGKDIFIDNQVVNGQVGYQVFTPFKLSDSNLIVLIARGWVSVGESRQVLPEIVTSSSQLVLEGRLNNPTAKPPLWNDKYPVSQGAVWQYLPIPEVADVLTAQVFPLVVELAPEASDSKALVRKWPEIDDQWVAKHQGYAFQWFAMATVFFIACLVLLLKSARRK